MISPQLLRISDGLLNMYIGVELIRYTTTGTYGHIHVAAESERKYPDSEFCPRRLI
jgi:hypothetical protein